MSEKHQQLLNWKPGAGVVVHVDPGLIPRHDLPSDAVPIQIAGKPAFHVTLIKRRAIERCTQAMARVWPGIMAELPNVPSAEPRHEVIQADDPVKNTRCWIVELRNAEAYEALRQELTRRLNRAFEDAGYVGLSVGDNPIRWHITIANNRGGDPFQSSGDPLRKTKQEGAFNE